MAVRETSTAYQQLQLQVLQWIAMSMMVMLPLARFLLLPDTGLSMPVRAAFFVYCAYLAVAVDERTVRVHGAVVTLMFFFVSWLRVATTDDAQVVLLMVVYGVYRVLPFLAALFGGVGLSIATGVLSAASPLVVVLSKRVLLGKITLEQAATAPQDALTDQERLIIIGEVYYLVIATAIAIAFERALNRALTLLADALAAKQQFITTMVCSKLNGSMGGSVGVWQESQDEPGVGLWQDEPMGGRFAGRAAWCLAGRADGWVIGRTS